MSRESRKGDTHEKRKTWTKGKNLVMTIKDCKQKGEKAERRRWKREKLEEAD